MTTLKRMREEAALSLDEVATACGVKRQAVWLWENGRTTPRPAHRRKLAKVFHCTTKDILKAIEETQNLSSKEVENDRAAA